MRAHLALEIDPIADARKALGLAGPANADAVTRAFRTAVKSAGASLLDGDETAVRRLIEARDMLRSVDRRLALPAPISTGQVTSHAIEVIVAATPEQVLASCQIEIVVQGRRFSIRLPLGVRTGDRLRLRGGGADGGDLLLPVVLRGGETLSAVGDDLYMSWPVAPRLLSDGGRIEIETHAGPRSAWVTPSHPTRRLRLNGLGLPARGRRPKGHLFVTLEPHESAPSATEDLMLRFTRVWTPDRLAA